jgi:lysophospholipase L1-like esterase
MKVILILVTVFVAAVCAGPFDPEPGSGGYWESKHAEFKRHTQQNPNIPIIFYGASWTEYFQNGPGNSVWNQFYAPLGAVNYGIGGDRTEHVLYRVMNGEVDGLNPKLVVLGGDPCSNGFGAHSNDLDIANGIRAIISALRQRLPNTKILYLGVLPRGDNNSLWQRTLNVNGVLPQWHDGNNVHYLSFHDAFTNGNGQIDSSIYEGDRLHFNTEGYRRWANNMNNKFFELLQ